ncbi:hypothetical protein CEXT_243911 [Caerostris extrusa]|uniref:Uncharacterized protein n=1 Tax=Caerostris extrusa TaxID=172846 RepID=A0AAV4RT95_CAEEX|nr:hypothetical protein CEXT_243911 [Caerostris extrusa]
MLERPTLEAVKYQFLETHTFEGKHVQIDQLRIGPPSSPDQGTASQHEHRAADEGAHAEHGDGEGQVAGVDLELSAVGDMVQCRYGPGDADTQKHIDSIAASYIPDGGVGVLVVHGGHLAGEGVCEDSHKRVEIKEVYSFKVDTWIGGDGIQKVCFENAILLVETKTSSSRDSPGTLVPRATNEMAVTESLSPTVHPKWEARSPHQGCQHADRRNAGDEARPTAQTVCDETQLKTMGIIYYLHMRKHC